MSEPRIPPRSPRDWDAEVLDALSVFKTKPPASAPGQGEQPELPRKRPGNMIRVFSWHPALMKGFLAFNDHLLRSTLPDRVRELVTIRVSWLRRGEYEWAQHVSMAREAGISEAEIDAIAAGPESALWGPLERALLASVDEMVADRYIRDETWKVLAEHLDREQLMDLVFTVGAYDMLAMAFNNFGLELDPGLSGFETTAEMDTHGIA